MAISLKQMHQYVTRLQSEKKEVHGKHITKLHNRASGELSGQEIKMLRDVKLSRGIK